MSFDVGDKVVYPHHGAAIIERREKRNVFGENREYLAALDDGGAVVRVDDFVSDIERHTAPRDDNGGQFQSARKRQPGQLGANGRELTSLAPWWRARFSPSPRCSPPSRPRRWPPSPAPPRPVSSPGTTPCSTRTTKPPSSSSSSTGASPSPPGPTMAASR